MIAEASSIVRPWQRGPIPTVAVIACHAYFVVRIVSLSEPRDYLLIPAAIFLADFATALIHWLCDRVLPRHWPIVVEFHEHHDHPLLTAQMPVVALFANSIYFSFALSWLAPSSVFYLQFLYFACFVQWTHSQAHRSSANRPRYVSRLQELRILLPPGHHAPHHRYLSGHYSVLTGWSNHLFDAMLSLPYLLASAFTAFFPGLRRRTWQNVYDFVSPRLGDDISVMNWGIAPVEKRIQTIEERFGLALYDRLLTPSLPGDRVLEIGSGRGGGLAWLARRDPHRRFIGIDLSVENIKVAKRRFGHDCAFIQGSADELPFANDSFDIVLNVESSHGYPDFDIFLSEVKRVLVPGGTLCFADFRPTRETSTLMAAWRNMQLEGQSENVTDRVLASCRKDSPRRVGIMKTLPRVMHPLLRNIMCLEHSQMYIAFKEDRYRYWMHWGTAGKEPAPPSV